MSLHGVPRLARQSTLPVKHFGDLFIGPIYLRYSDIGIGVFVDFWLKKRISLFVCVRKA